MTPSELILAQFPGRVYITLVQAGEAIGLSKQTSYNRHHKGTFPLPVTMVGRKPMVALTDLVNFMDPEKPKIAKPTIGARRRKGRPRNVDKS